MELEPDENMKLDSTEVSLTTLEGGPLRCKQPGCDSERIYPNFSALQ